MSAPILLLHSSAGRYGADLQLLALAGGLDRERFAPRAVLPERGELAAMLADADVPVSVTPRLAVLRRADLSPRGLARLLVDTRAADRELDALVAQERPALIHSNTSVVLSGARLARRLRVPHAVHVRELYPRVPLAWRAWRHRLLRADRLLCVSEAVAAQFDGAAHTVVVPDGLPRAPRRAPRAQARAAVGLDESVFTVAVLGRVSAWKGQDVLARALAEPPLAEIRAVGLVAGEPWPGADGPLHELERLRDRLGLGDRLRLLGFRSDLDVVLGAADVVAVPSTRPDPLPNAALEAAATGVPVVAAAHGGLPEIVRDGRTGLLVPPAAPAALASALRSLADDPERARRMGEAGARDAAERFSTRAMLARVEAQYEELLG